MPQPHQGEAYEFYVALTEVDDPSLFVEDPTIVLGDFKISKAGGAEANLTTTPVVTPVGSFNVKVNLSAVEMTGADKVSILGKDAAGEQWRDIFVFIDIPIGNHEKATELLLGDMEVTKTRSITRRAGTAVIIRDKDVSGSRLDVTDTIRTTEHI